ncbi:acyl transferase/acyl hydrolase/lysophospholipase [Aspergillus minisclerotigenes]|uniref:Acyl transferase/acyl hydrolase/lysophospholipase n=1 Tax=Aspergillus minisclerotigenes TaxID=656917 RepID=A0A5N6JEX9_9EURO|nr:acyl transferase/acyl hydrolase/lysophospholipase [Aspergillus minisclerotigenes]
MSFQKLGNGPRILCLDGGGMRGLSEILILKDLMIRVQQRSKLDFTPEPHHCFDYICGTSTGGLIAVLIGRLGKTLDECQAIFEGRGAEIFHGGSVKRAARLAVKGSRFSNKGLQKVIGEQVNDDVIMHESELDEGHVPVAVVAISKTTRKHKLFRTYGVRASLEKCSISNACLATAAATTYFEPVTIDHIDYVDGGFGKNNPSDAAIDELQSDDYLLPLDDPVRQVGCFVSIGTGRATYQYDVQTLFSYFGFLKPAGVKAVEEAVQMSINIATESHDKHLDIEKRFETAKRLDCYYRFDVDRGLEAVELSEGGRQAITHIEATTRAYMDENVGKLAACADKLNPRTHGNAVRIIFDSFDLKPGESSGPMDYETENGLWKGCTSNGVYTVEGREGASNDTWIHMMDHIGRIGDKVIDLRDCSLSVAVRIREFKSSTDGKLGAGIVIRFVEGKNNIPLKGLALLKEPNHCYSIFEWRNGTPYRECSFSPQTLTGPSYNGFDTLKITANGNTVRFMVNGQLCAEKDDEAPSEFLHVAITAMGHGTFEFDDLELWQ